MQPLLIKGLNLFRFSYLKKLTLLLTDGITLRSMYPLGMKGGINPTFHGLLEILCVLRLNTCKKIITSFLCLKVLREWKKSRIIISLMINSIILYANENIHHHHRPLILCTCQCSNRWEDFYFLPIYWKLTHNFFLIYSYFLIDWLTVLWLLSHWLIKFQILNNTWLYI